MKGKMKNIEDTIIEGLQASLKNCFDEYQTKNTFARDLKGYKESLHDEIKYFGEDADIIPKLIAALNFGDSEEIVKIFFSWYKSNKGWANTLPSMVFFKDTEIEHFVNALKKAVKSYEYWMPLTTMFDCGEISISKDNMEYLLMQAIRNDRLRPFAYAYLFYEELSRNHTKELEEIVDDLFKNHPDALNELFFEVSGTGLLIYEGYNPYFTLAKCYRNLNDQNGFIRNYRKGVKVNPPEIFTPYFLLFEYETKNWNYEKAALAFKDAKIEEDTINDREATLLTNDSWDFLEKVWKNVHLLGYKKLLEAIFPMDEFPQFGDCLCYKFLWLTYKELSSLHDFNEDPLAGFEFELVPTKMENILLETRLKLILTEVVLDRVKNENQNKILKEIFHNLRKHERSLAEEEFTSKVASAKLAERDQIYSNISHSIKNLLASSIIDPLWRLKESNEKDNSFIVDRALKGADMIRRIVNAINNSSAGSFEDFVYDANNHIASDADSQTLSLIIYNALYYSLGNIFDGRGAGRLMRKYFTDNKSANIAWKELGELESENFDQISKFCNKYLFSFNLTMSDLNELVLADTKGSATKMLILFQEIFFNAVKYYNPDKNGEAFCHIIIEKRNNKLHLEVNNTRSDKILSKGSGLGTIIIEKMSKLMHADIDINQADNSYSVEIDIPDFWQNDFMGEVKGDKVIYSQDEDVRFLQVSEKQGEYGK